MWVWGQKIVSFLNERSRKLFLLFLLNERSGVCQTEAFRFQRPLLICKTYAHVDMLAEIFGPQLSTIVKRDKLKHPCYRKFFLGKIKCWCQFWTRSTFQSCFLMMILQSVFLATSWHFTTTWRWHHDMDIRSVRIRGVSVWAYSIWLLQFISLYTMYISTRRQLAGWVKVKSWFWIKILFRQPAYGSAKTDTSVQTLQKAK